MSEQIVKVLEIIRSIATIIAALVGIFVGVRKKELFKTKTEAKGKDIIHGLVLILIPLVIIILILSVFLLTKDFYGLKIKKSGKLEQTRYELMKNRDDLYFEVVQEYENLNDTNSHPSHTDSISVSIKAFKLRNKIISFQDTGLDAGLRIFKYDNLSYTCNIISALELSHASANAWADSAIVAIKKAFQWIDYIEPRPSEFSEEYLEKLIVWINDDDVKNRLYYLWGWALAIKRVNHDINVQPSDIEEKIGNINTDIYLESYPIKLIYQFQQLKGQFSESFRHRYFR